MLRDEYQAVVTYLNIDLEHLENQMCRTDCPRETAHLRRLYRELVGKRDAYQLALESIKKDPPLEIGR